MEIEERRVKTSRINDSETVVRSGLGIEGC